MGIGLIVIGLLVAFGPLAFDLGGTESPPASGGDESDGTGGSDANTDGASGAEGNDDADGIRVAIGEAILGDDSPQRAADDEKREECFVE